jgi:hypothetical protein
MSQADEPHSKLTHHLIDTSRQFLIQAFQAFGREEPLAYYLYAGIAIEHLLKAQLTHVHPVLLADPKNFKSMLALAELSDSDLPSPIVRTVTYTESLQRLLEQFPALRPIESRLVRVSGYRNGAAHAGLVDRSTIPEGLLAILQFCEALLAELTVDRTIFYGDFLTMVDARLDASQEHERIMTDAAIANARIQFEQRYEGLTPGYNIVEALNEGDVGDYETQRYDCPACGSLARLNGSVDHSWSPTFDEKGELTGSLLEVDFWPWTLDCKVCGLSLHGPGLRLT